jgi:uncharacterized protein (TIGR03086 family)
MSASSPAAPTVGGVGLLERAVGYTLGCLQPVTVEALNRPTPCARWDLRALLGHLHDSLATLDEAATGQLTRTGVGQPPEDADLVIAVRHRARAVVGGWVRSPVDEVGIAGWPVSAAVVTAAGALEVAVHGWDVAHASGDPRPLPAELAAELLPLAPLLVTEQDRPGRFGPALPCRPDAAPATRLLAFLGRAAASGG